MTIVRNTFIGVFTKIAVLSVLFINSLLVIKILGPKWQGVYFMITVTNGLLLNFLNLGMNVSNTTFLAKDRLSFGRVNSNALVLALGSGVFSIFLYLVFYPFLQGIFFKSIDAGYMLMGISLLPFSMYEIMWTSMMVGLNEIPLIYKYQVIKNTAFLLLNIVALLFLGLGFYGAFYSWVFITIASSSVLVYLGHRRERLKLQFYPALFKETLSFGIKNYWGNIATNIWRRFDVYIITIFSGLTAVGYYSFAVTIRDVVWQLVEPVYNATFAKITSIGKKESADLTSSVTRHVALNATIVSGAFMIAGYLAIKFVVGNSYEPSLLPLFILLLGSPGVGITMVLSIYLIGQLNKPGLVSLFAWINAVINVVLCLLLIPRFGIVGAALSSMGMCVIGTLLVLLVFKKFSGYGIKDTILLRAEDLTSYYDIFRKIKVRMADLKRQRTMT